MSNKVANAMKTLKKALKDNPDLAYSWHCNLACAMMDTGITHVQANAAANRFMHNAFNVETRY